MLSKLMIYLLKKPLVKAALKEVISPCESEYSKKDNRETLEALTDKLVNNPRLYQEVLDDFYKNPSIPSPYHKFPPAFYRAALRLYSVINSPEHHNVPLARSQAVQVAQPSAQGRQASSQEV